jgi:hypothetical protein
MIRLPLPFAVPGVWVVLPAPPILLMLIEQTSCKTCPFFCFGVAELLLRVLVCAKLLVAGLIPCDRRAVWSWPFTFVIVCPEQAVVIWLACPTSLLIVDPLFLVFALPINDN